MARLPYGPGRSHARTVHHCVQSGRRGVYLPFQYNSSAHPAPTPALYVHIPKTQVIFVLAALVVGEGDTDARWSDGSLSVEQLDLSGHGGSFPDIPEGYAQPLHESRVRLLPSP